MTPGQWFASGCLATLIGGLAALGAAIGFGRAWLREAGRPLWNKWLAQEKCIYRANQKSTANNGDN